MYYIIQENVFRSRHNEMLVETLDRCGIEYESVKFRPFIHEVEFKTERKDVFCFGADTMPYVAKKYGWFPGSMLDENHDFEIYAPKYGLENMLNGDGAIIEFGDPIPLDNYLFFARPTRDTKVFAGQVFTQDSWKEYVTECTANNAHTIIQKETKCLIAPLHEIQQEVRCWIVNGKVVTASRYKIGSRVLYQNYDDESFYVNFAQQMANKFSVAEAYVMDICLVENALKIVEINCINAAGFYDCNMQKLIGALEEHFNKHEK